MKSYLKLTFFLSSVLFHLNFLYSVLKVLIEISNQKAWLINLNHEIESPVIMIVMLCSLSVNYGCSTV